MKMMIFKITIIVFDKAMNARLCNGRAITELNNGHKTTTMIVCIKNLLQKIRRVKTYLNENMLFQRNHLQRGPYLLKIQKYSLHGFSN